MTGSDLVLASRVREIGRRVKRWQSGTMVLRWTAAGALEAEQCFGRVAGYRGLPLLVAATHAHDSALHRAMSMIDVARRSPKFVHQ